MIEVGSYWRYIFTDRVIRIIEVRTRGLSAEWLHGNTTFKMDYDKEYFLTMFEQITPLELELL